MENEHDLGPDGARDADAEDSGDETDEILDDDYYDDDDDYDSQYDGYDSEVDVFEFTDSEDEENVPTYIKVYSENGHTQDTIVSGPAAGVQVSGPTPGTGPSTSDSSSSQPTTASPRQPSPLRPGLAGGFISRIM